MLRKIIRRAITHGRLLGQTKPFLREMVFAVRDLMQDAYPELNETVGRVSKAVLAEEERFAHTLDVGLQRLEELVKAAVANHRRHAVQDVIDKWWIEKRPYFEEVQRVLSASVTNLSPRDEVAIEILMSQLRPTLGLSLGDELQRRLRDAFGAPPSINGANAFQLYDTFGMPLDFVQDAARDRGLAFDPPGFDRAEVPKVHARIVEFLATHLP